MPEELLTIAQAADSLGMSAGAVRRAILRGALAATKLGPRTVFLKRRDIERYRVTPKHAGGRPRTTAPKPEAR